jgi:hypothetical protein
VTAEAREWDAWEEAAMEKGMSRNPWMADACNLVAECDLAELEGKPSN